MKISSILNYSVNNKFALLPQGKPQGIQYSYNLPCDTVTFGQAKKKDVDDDDWLDERDMNSDALLKHVEDNNFKQAVILIENLEPKYWDPNYPIFDAEHGDNCLLGVVIDKLENAPSGSKEWKELLELSGKIIEHPEFKVKNESSNQDLVMYSIEAYCPEIAHQLLESGDLLEDLENAKLAFYEKMAKDAALSSVASEIRELKKAQNICIDSENGLTNGSRSISNIKQELSLYEVTKNENDPKSLDEVGGMFQVKKDITEFILKPWNKDFRDKIVENKLNRPSGFLLSGPPGCGKTYIMKAIAAETGYNLYEINLANIGDSSGYKTQNELKNVFDNLENLYKETGEPSIVILDELDSIAMNRKNCHTDWKKDDINALLMVMNNSAQKGIIIVGATNNPEDLDDAVKRSGRLDKHIKIGLPDIAEAKDIVEKILQDRPIGVALLEHSDEIAEKLKGLSPADMSSILHNTCLNAIYEYKDAADMEDFDKMFKALKHDSNDKGRIVIKGFNQ